MGKLRAGKKLKRSMVIKIANNAMKKADDRKMINQNMLLYNAGLHLKLSKELCICHCGASQHFSEGNKCNTIGCTGCATTGFRSNYDASYSNWIKEIKQIADQKHGLVILDASMPSKEELIQAFEGGAKPEAFAEVLVEQLTAPTPAAAAPAQDSPAPEETPAL